jgi:hypothetical protein
MDMDTVLATLDRSAVGVFAYVMRSGRPNACAVTPYVVDGVATVTSTLALVDKAAAVRRDPRVALLAGGAHLGGRASVSVDLTPSWFDQHLRDQERAKYPPARSILGVPGHRCLFSWYLGRVVISIDDTEAAVRPGDDHTTITVLDSAGALQTFPIADLDDATADSIPVPSIPDGHAVVLIHEENESMTSMRQLAIHGEVASGVFAAVRRRGTIEPEPHGLRAQLRTSRTMARQAKANRPRLQTWAATTT